MERPVVSGIAYHKNQAKITIKGVPDQPGIAAKIFETLGKASIIVDMIIQNISEEGFTNISFTLEKDRMDEALAVMKQAAREIRAKEVTSNPNIAKVSIIGAGMRSHSGIASRMFQALSNENINLMMISTSEIRVSCVIDKKYTELAVRTLHEAFDLKSDPVAITTAEDDAELGLDDDPEPLPSEAPEEKKAG